MIMAARTATAPAAPAFWLWGILVLCHTYVTSRFLAPPYRAQSCDHPRSARHARSATISDGFCQSGRRPLGRAARNVSESGRGDFIKRRDSDGLPFGFVMAPFGSAGFYAPLVPTVAAAITILMAVPCAFGSAQGPSAWTTSSFSRTPLDHCRPG